MSLRELIYYYFLFKFGKLILYVNKLLNNKKQVNKNMDELINVKANFNKSFGYHAVFKIPIQSEPRLKIQEKNQLNKI